MNVEEERSVPLCYNVGQHCRMTVYVTEKEDEAIGELRKVHPELTLSQAIDQVLDKTSPGNEN